VRFAAAKTDVAPTGSVAIVAPAIARVRNISMCPNTGGLRRARHAALHGRVLFIAGLAQTLLSCVPQRELSSYSSGATPSVMQAASSDVQQAPPATLNPSPVTDQAELSLDAGATVRSVMPAQTAVPDGRGGDAPCAPSCGTPRGAFRGRSTQSLLAAGLDRSFIYYAPERLDPELPAPLLIVAHGFSVSADELFGITRFDSLADRDGFLLAFPNGQGFAPWNVGSGTCPTELGNVPSASGDDQAFIDEILSFVESDRALDRERVFVTGFASGGYFASEVGCSRSDVRAIASHSGGSRSLDGCSAEPLPVILFHGVLDDVVPVECGLETRQRWAEHNGCGGDVEVREILGGACEYSRGCPPGGQVALCLFDQLGPSWAGGFGQDGTANPSFASAAELTWEFLQQYAW
jgi:polyhydroxybutyrate depolymerase